MKKSEILEIIQELQNDTSISNFTIEFEWEKTKITVSKKIIINHVSTPFYPMQNPNLYPSYPSQKPLYTLCNIN